MNTILKKIIHEATKPFVDSGPFGAGPAYGAQNPRHVARSLFDLNQKTWTPPRALLHGDEGTIVKKIGEFYPVLSVGDGSGLTINDKDLSDKLVKIANQVVNMSSIQKDTRELSRVLHNAVSYEFGSHQGGYDQKTFLHHLKDPNLATADGPFHKKIAAVNAIAQSEIENLTVTAEDWNGIIKNAYRLEHFQGDEFLEEVKSGSSSSLEV